MCVFSAHEKRARRCRLDGSMRVTCAHAPVVFRQVCRRSWPSQQVVVADALAVLAQEIESEDGADAVHVEAVHLVEVHKTQRNE